MTERKVLLEGRPGVGKTTAIMSIVGSLQSRGRAVTGFVTEELRERGRRVGFSVAQLGGPRAVLAHVDLPGPPRVGKYGVDAAEFERLALPTLQRGGPEVVVVVDEIGKMELASDPFRRRLLGLIEDPGSLLASVHAHRHPFTDGLKRRPDVVLLRLTLQNRDRVPAKVIDLLTPEG